MLLRLWWSSGPPKATPPVCHCQHLYKTATARHTFLNAFSHFLYLSRCRLGTAHRLQGTKRHTVRSHSWSAGSKEPEGFFGFRLRCCFAIPAPRLLKHLERQEAWGKGKWRARSLPSSFRLQTWLRRLSEHKLLNLWLTEFVLKKTCPSVLMRGYYSLSRNKIRKYTWTVSIFTFF